MRPSGPVAAACPKRGIASAAGVVATAQAPPDPPDPSSSSVPPGTQAVTRAPAAPRASRSLKQIVMSPRHADQEKRDVSPIRHAALSPGLSCARELPPEHRDRRAHQLAPRLGAPGAELLLDLLEGRPLD